MHSQNGHVRRAGLFAETVDDNRRVHELYFLDVNEIIHMK